VQPAPATYCGRVTRGDLDTIIAGLVQLRREVDLALDHAVVAGRAEHDLSWDEVADLTGMTRRAVVKRWGDPAPNGPATNGKARAKRTVTAGAAKRGAAKTGTGTVPG
jgi:hypothetical protein